ncbi:hypothetical protein OSTOST_11400 [Ostertagia ostertagi]
MAANDHLFDAFPATTKEQWIQQVIKDLKGGDFNTILNYTSRDGIVIHPFYTEEDLAKYSERKPLFSHTDWEEGIGEFDTQLSSYLSAKKLDRSTLNLIVSYDPIHQLVETGSGLEAAEQAAFIKHINSAKDARNCCINGAIYHNAGASPAYEIACIAAHANEYFQWMEKPGVPVQVQVSVGPDYFFEIAKLRALRKVMTLLAAAYETEMDISLHAETATRNLTLYDTHNNLLRTTTEAMAATIGGCNSLVRTPENTTDEQACHLIIEDRGTHLAYPGIRKPYGFKAFYPDLGKEQQVIYINKIAKCCYQNRNAKQTDRL